MKRNATCVNSKLVDHTVLRHSRFVTSEEITFSCCAIQREFFNREGRFGRVEFEGCDCAC